MRFFTLIHVPGALEDVSEADIEGVRKKILPYLLCAVQLNRTLESSGVMLSVVTNKADLLRSLLGKDHQIDLIELKFTLDVPEDVKFYSAHYKIETYKYLSTLNQDYVALVDCDVTCIQDINTAFQHVIDEKLPLYYDITDQMVPAFGLERVINDKQMISGRRSVGLWAGGEFLSGAPDFFKDLCIELESVKVRYFHNYKVLFHEGDEMLTSVAIESMLLKGYPLFDAGKLGVIARYWSINTRHHQKSFRAYEECFLLHLPADKEFLSSFTGHFSRGNIIDQYKRHLLRRKPRKTAARLLSFLKSNRSKK